MKAKPKKRERSENVFPFPVNVNDYRTIKELSDYLHRIASADELEIEQRNFKRFALIGASRDGYKRDRFTIVLEKDGTVTQCPKGMEPTKAETDAIKKAFASPKIKFPSSVLASDASADRQRRERGVAEEDWFEIRDHSRKAIVMVQQRIKTEEGLGKSYLPWTLWSDNEWRQMEPEGLLLPVWKPKEARPKLRIMLHEGAKAARYVDWLVNSIDPEVREALAAHPWADSLVDYEHFGWIGGAPNPQRTDWKKELNRPGIETYEIVIACDHDQVGEDALSEISRRLLRPLRALKFGDAFASGFDLADTFPTDLWQKNSKGHNVYIGPDFVDCLSPATWATDEVLMSGEKGKGGRPTYKLRDEFVKEWMASIVPKKFVNRDNLNKRYTDKEFNQLMSPLSHVEDVAKLLCKRPSCQAEIIAYDPSKKSGLVRGDRKSMINVHQQSDIVASLRRSEEEYDAGPWIDFMTHLIPKPEDRDHTLKWCATLIARPDIHMLFAMLLISETQGIGKTTLATILSKLIGKANCSFPSANEVTKAEFTAWRAFKRLVIISELYDGETARAYNRLKDIITDPDIRCNEKFEKAYDLPNWSHIFATSNSVRALKLSGTDRRWFMPGVTEEKRGHEYWVELNSWIEGGGLRAIALWARDYVKEKGHFRTGVEAPASSTKMRSIVAAMSDGEKFVCELGKNLAGLKTQHVVRLDHLRLWLMGKKSADPKYGDGSKYLETNETIYAILRQCGLKPGGKRFKIGREERFRVIANFDIDARATWENIADKLKTPGEVYSSGKEEGEEGDDPF